MRRYLWGWLLVLGACPPDMPPPPPPPTPPQVFLTVDERTVIGDQVTGKVNVSGCNAVTQVQLLQGGSFLADANYTKSPTAFSLPASLFRPLWNRLGIAAPLKLSAKVVCDDARTNTSQVVGVTFFPVANKFGAGGVQVMPDAFVAEGGLGGGATTFLGCVGTQQGTALARVNTSGQIVQQNIALPHACSYDTEISDRSPVTGTRWVMQPDQGAYAIDANLQVTAQYAGKVKRMAVGRSGVAVFWEDVTSSTTSTAIRLNPMGGPNPLQWRSPAGGIVNSNPVVNEGDNVAYVSTWQFDMGAMTGDVVVFKFNLQTGALVNGVGAPLGPPIIYRQTYSAINIPLTPYGTFNQDGSLFIVPFLSTDVSGTVHSTVLACATQPMFGQCMNTDRRWTSRTFDGVVSLVLPFSAGNYLAALGPYQAWFLDPVNGTIRNLGEQPLRPSGSLQLLAVQPGNGSEFYLLNGPVAEGITTYPVEIVATDKPESGELWRFDQGSGESPIAGLFMAVDEAGQAWLRVGPDQVKPLTNIEYRSARGPTILP